MKKLKLWSLFVYISFYKMSNNSKDYCLEHVLISYSNYKNYTDTENELCKKYGKDRCRRVNFPEYISENLARHILIKMNIDTNITRNTKTGDLKSDKYDKIEIKSVTSDGPMSFGPSENWNILVILKIDLNDDFIICYLVNLKNDNDIIQNIQLSKNETYGECCKKGKRPHISLDLFLKEIKKNKKNSNDNIKIIFSGKLEYLNTNKNNKIIEKYLFYENLIFNFNQDNNDNKEKLEILKDKKNIYLNKLDNNNNEDKNEDRDKKNKLKNNNLLSLSLNNNNNKMSNLKKLKHCDLFAGTGAFSLALQNTGKIDTVYANDMEPASEKIYNANFNDKLVLKDINDIDVKTIPSHDILTGGFPCQPFSIAGKQLGFNDKRSNVFWKILEIIDYHNPSIIILENVKNLLTHDNENTFKIIKKNIEDRDYFLKYKILDTSKITGIPQHRERIYIIAFKNKSIFGKDIFGDKFNMDFGNISKKNFHDFLEKNIDKKYYYTEKLQVYDTIKNSVISKDSIYQYRRTLVRENKKGECPTLTANMGSGGHNIPLILDNDGIRKLTPKECFNFQGFPNNYNINIKLCDSALYKLAGNAVSYPVIKLIIDRILDHLDI